MHAGLVLSAHAHNIEYYGLVKVVNNASATPGLAGSDPQTGMQNQNVRYLYLPSLDLVQRESVVFWLISPRALYYTTRSNSIKPLIQPSSNKSRSIDCTMCTLCSIEL